MWDQKMLDDITNQIGIFFWLKQFSSVKNLLPMNYEAFVQEELISFEHQIRKHCYQVTQKRNEELRH